MANHSKNIIIGSRSSLLAKEHINIFERQLKKKFGKDKTINVEKKFFKTSGDKFMNKKISDIGNKGLFSKEIDEALINFDINLGIHSLKDLPTDFPKDLEIGAVLKREDTREALLSNQKSSIKSLKKNAIVGTSSIRREMQLKRLRPDLIIKNIRGNIDTRLKKLKAKKFDAILLAYAGLKRLKISAKYILINPRVFSPALGQGAIALVVNKKNKKVNSIISKLNHYKTYIETECERIFLKALDGSCKTPVGGYALLKKIGKEEKIFFSFSIFSDDGKIFIRDRVILDLKNFRSESYDLGVKIKKKIHY